jgi:hypothetical protein
LIYHASPSGIVQEGEAYITSRGRADVDPTIIAGPTTQHRQKIPSPSPTLFPRISLCLKNASTRRTLPCGPQAASISPSFFFKLHVCIHSWTLSLSPNKRSPPSTSTSSSGGSRGLIDSAPSFLAIVPSSHGDGGGGVAVAAEAEAPVAARRQRRRRRLRVPAPARREARLRDAAPLGATRDRDPERPRPGRRRRRAGLVHQPAGHHVVARVRQGQLPRRARRELRGRAHDPAPAGEARGVRVPPADAVGAGGEGEGQAAAEARPALPPPRRLPRLPRGALPAVTRGAGTPPPARTISGSFELCICFSLLF